MPYQTISDYYNIPLSLFLGFLLGGIILGCVETTAWKFYFPTSIELLLWRVSSLVIIAAFPLLYAIIMFITLTPFRKWRESRVEKVTSYISFAIFLFARLFILFQTIYSLFHLPPGVFISTWSSNIPHLV
jgi:hypothetical protein